MLQQVPQEELLEGWRASCGGAVEGLRDGVVTATFLWPPWESVTVLAR